MTQAAQTTTTPNSSDEVRSMVSDAYAAALEKKSCCGVDQRGEAAKVSLGYSDDDLAENGDVTSFGCGNPLAFQSVEEGQTVLDLGSGAGFDLLQAAKKVGPNGKVIGVDMTDAMIEAARANAKRYGFEQIEIRKGLIEKLPVEDASVDWVISNCVINLSPEKDKVFAEIARVLKPGGRFSVSDIVAEDLPEEFLNHAAAYAACVAGAIPEETYKAGLTAAGLEDVQVTERQVYEAPEIRAIVESDLESFDIPTDAFEGLLGKLEGKVASVRVEGQKAAACCGPSCC